MRRILMIAALLAVTAQAEAAKTIKKPPPLPKTPILKLANVEQTAEDANSGAGSPLLEWMRDTGPVLSPNGAPMDVIPDFRVTVMRSPVVMRRRELVDSDGAFKDTQAASYAVDIAPGAAQNGVVASGGWECGTAKYFITMRSYVIDADGKHSNALRYTIHCNGG
ncbi:MAG: hypothetical protein H0U98_11190 [Alphaproteobacteria bacterium]|nr:hypothetical protein [Alphaproteobacteria bacterium]